MFPCRDLQRKCWWDGIEVELKQPGEDTPRNIKLWARRVWTLELSLVRSPPCIPGDESFLNWLRQV
jgi:hypothetical protein